MSRPFNSYILANDNLVVELACAGFSVDQLEVTVEGNDLVVRGTKFDNPFEVKRYLSRGLSYANFVEKFNVPYYYTLSDVRILDGVLRVEFELFKKSFAIQKGRREEPVIDMDVCKAGAEAILKASESSKAVKK